MIKTFYQVFFMQTPTVLRQSAAELLALVVVDLFPGALLAESVATEFGFYCDIIAAQPIDDYAIPLLEEKMRSLAKQGLEVRSLDMMREVAANFLEHKGQPLRGKAAGLANDNIISLIQIGDFCDYCEAPYISNTQEIEFFKLFGVEEATHFISGEGLVGVKRIYGTVSTDKPNLKKLVKALQSGKKCDHTKLPQAKELFSFHEELSDTDWVWESNGAALKRGLRNWWENEHLQQRFQLVTTPLLVKESLIRKLGVYDDRLASFDFPIFEQGEISYVIPPTTAPAHLLLFQTKLRHERDMPIRYAECASVISREQFGKLWGLFNSSIVNADFAHIFCAPKHLEAEIISSLQFIDKFIKMFDFEYYWSFKDRGQRFAGTENKWEKAKDSFKSAFQACGFNYVDKPQEGCFAGPVVEAWLVDRFGREWKGPSVALDFNAPDRSGLSYQTAEGKNSAPLMIVRSMFDSFERFVALLLEHTSGALPAWLSSEQANENLGSKEVCSNH